MSALAHAFNAELLGRLSQLSRRHQYDPYVRFDWPAQIDRSRPWCDEDLLTTYGTTFHAELTEEQMIALSHWECLNFFSLNVHGIKGALEFLMRSIYEKRYRVFSEYLHFFMAEENFHMWFFAKFCLDYTGKIYPSIAMPAVKTGDPVEQDLYMFASTLIFEEYVDFYNNKVGRNAKVPDLLREINHQHHVDESRHIAFGREVVKYLYAQLLAQDESEQAAPRVRLQVQRIFVYFIGLMYNPAVYQDAGLAAVSGLPNATALRNHLRNDPTRRQFHQQWFERTAGFFVKQGILENADFI
ncbi:MAG: diiron oxygenase [Ramlibacter sp.]|nr:diiron oxygenase [Ramlibacter sp.]